MLEGACYHGEQFMGEWKFVDEDWGDWTPDQREGRWLRTWNGVRQVLHWFPASSQERQPE